MALRTETSLVLPAEFVRHCCGLALDIGGSVIKAVYRTKADLEEAKKQGAEVGHLQLVSLSQPHVAEALEHIRDRAAIGRQVNEGGQPTPTVFTTGLGCTQHGKFICDTLNIKLENQLEFDCFVRGFHFLAANVPRTVLFEPYDDAAGQAPLETMRQQFEMLKATIEAGQCGATNVDVSGGLDPLAALGKVTSDSGKPVAEAEPDLYPCLLAMCGSGNGFFRINADGTFQILDGSNRGGRTFYGLGTLLTGCRTYDELLALAEKGNPRTVDMYSDTLFSGGASGAVEGEESMYSRAGAGAGDPVLIYSFGRAVGAKLEDFKREDVARALLDQFVVDAVQTLTLVAAVAGLKRVALCGSFVNSPLVRARFTTEIVKRNIFGSALRQEGIQIDFVKPAAYLGAIGALVTDYEKYTGANVPCGN